MARLSKRQKEVLETYATDIPSVVFGCDYQVAMGLVVSGLLNLDNVSGKLTKGDGVPGKKFKFELVMWRDSESDLSLRRKTFTVKDPRKVGKVSKEFIKENAKIAGFPANSFYAEIIPLA